MFNEEKFKTAATITPHTQKVSIDEFAIVYAYSILPPKSDDN